MNTPKIIKRIAVSEVEITKALHRLAALINTHYKDVDEPVVCIGLLHGCLPFLSDLLKLTNFSVEVNFLEINSYDGTDAKIHDGKIVNKNIVSDFAGRHVLIIDDIIESAKSLQLAKKFVESRHPASIKSVVLVTKHNHEDVVDQVDWWGVRTEDKFLIGYGLDYQKQYRYLSYIGIANQDYIGELKRKKQGGQ